MPKTHDEIIDAYGQHLRENGQPPESVFRFCQTLGIEEKDFFHAFGSFEAVENAFWGRMLDRVVRAVQSGPEWPGFSARHQLLAFLYAFAEESLSVRSLMLQRFAKISVVGTPVYLNGFEARFKEFASELIQHGLATQEIASRGIVSSFYPRAFYTHFRSVIDFHLRDTSKNYEKTDAFIEKTVALAFDLVRSQALDSAADLFRFLAPWQKPGFSR